MTKLLLKLIPLVVTLAILGAVIGFEPTDRRWQLVGALLPFVVAFGISKFVAGDFGRSSTGLALVAGFVFAVLGGMQMGTPGMVSGGLVGYMAADFLLCVPLGAVSGMLGVLGIHIKRTENDDEPVPSYPVRLFAALVRLAGVVYLALVCHEMFWFVNIGADALSAQVGAQILQSSQREDEPEFLKDRLAEQRWAVAAFRSPPLVYALRPAADENSRSAFELIDLFAGKSFPVDERNRWQEKVVAPAGETISADDIDDAALAEIGADLSLTSIDDIESCFSKTLYVRRVLNAQEMFRAADQLREQISTTQDVSFHPRSR